MSHSYAFLPRKPIYGSTDAPIRCYTKFARHLRKLQYYPRKVDICLFITRHAATGELVAILVLRVDDLIMDESTEDHAALITCLVGFKHGEVQKLQNVEPIAYFGLTLVRRRSSIVIARADLRSPIQAVRKKDSNGSDSRPQYDRFLT